MPSDTKVTRTDLVVRKLAMALVNTNTPPALIAFIVLPEPFTIYTVT